MKTRSILKLALLVGLLAVPATAQEHIVGFFEGQPGALNSGSGAIPVKGWVLAESGVRQVIVQIDGFDVGQAIFGAPRPAVTRMWPDFPDSAGPAFSYRINSTQWPNGPHTVSVKVISQAGNIATLGGTRQILFNNNTQILAPFGQITTPQRNAQIFGTCDPLDPRRRLVPVEGWALDLGVETNDAGVGWVELMVDNQIFSNSRTGCFFALEAGGLTNCYGLPRPEIERLFPFAKDAPNAGYRFVLDIGFMISSLGFTEGQHLLTIRSGDISNQTADVDEIPVVFRCIEDVNEGSFGRIESPRSGRTYAGNMPVQGWAVDWEGVETVMIRVDGVLVGQADFGADDGIFETRPQVFSRYSTFPDADAPVWRLVPAFDTNTISDGAHQLQVNVIDQEGDITIIGETTFFVDNIPN